MNDNRSRSWLSVLAIAGSMVIAGLVVVTGISLILNGGDVDKIIDMLEHAGLVVIGFLVAVVVIFAAFLVSDSTSRILDRMWVRPRPNSKNKISLGVDGSAGLFLIVTSLLFIVILSVLGRYQLVYDTIRVVIAFSVLCLVCWCIDRVRSKKRRWRESGRQGRWWDQK